MENIKNVLKLEDDEDNSCSLRVRKYYEIIDTAATGEWMKHHDGNIQFDAICIEEEDCKNKDRKEELIGIHDAEDRVVDTATSDRDDKIPSTSTDLVTPKSSFK